MEHTIDNILINNKLFLISLLHEYTKAITKLQNTGLYDTIRLSRRLLNHMYNFDVFTKISIGIRNTAVIYMCSSRDITPIRFNIYINDFMIMMKKPRIYKMIDEDSEEMSVVTHVTDKDFSDESLNMILDDVLDFITDDDDYF